MIDNESILEYRGIKIKGANSFVQPKVAAIVQAPKFRKWIDEFKLDEIDLKEFIVTDADFFHAPNASYDPQKLGFVKGYGVAFAKATGEKISSIAFLRGESVAVLIVVKVKETGNLHILLCRQLRFPAGGFLTEACAGMIDSRSSDVRGVVFSEIQEETGFTVSVSDLISLGSIIPSGGGCDEEIHLFAWETEISEAEFHDKQTKIFGTGQQERIKLMFCSYDTFDEEVQKLRDVKAECCWHRYLRNSKRKLFSAKGTPLYYKAVCPGFKVAVTQKPQVDAPVSGFIRDGQVISVHPSINFGFHELVTGEGFVFMSSSKVSWIPFDTSNAAMIPSLATLCKIIRNACETLAPLVSKLYYAHNAESSKLKSDFSLFTIADGVVQCILKDYLFAGDKFDRIVGEEDEAFINLSEKPYSVDHLPVPEQFVSSIDTAVREIKIYATQIDALAYKHLTVFIDPIDGTREFARGLGEQCTILVGFADRTKKPVAGVVYRPLSSPPTWATGAVSEFYAEQSLLTNETPSVGMLTSNGSISPFLEAVMSELDLPRIPTGGAGNKVLMLLEGRAEAYIQDRGVSRWDTCAAQAVLEAIGGCLNKLSNFMINKEMKSYSYAYTDVNLDFEPGLSYLTIKNSRLKIADAETKIKGVDPNQYKPYSNLCGLIALSAKTVGDPAALNRIYNAMKSAGIAPLYE